MNVRTLLNLGAACILGSMSLCCGLARPAQADSWKPALHDAQSLFNASRSLHDRAEHFYDAQVLPASARLEQMTAQLVNLLRAEACAAEVLPVYRAIMPALEDASTCVQLSHTMRVDRRSQSVLADARRCYAATGEHLQCVHPPVVAPVVAPIVGLPRVSGYPSALPYAPPPSTMSAQVGGIRITTPSWYDVPRSQPVYGNPNTGHHLNGPWNGPQNGPQSAPQSGPRHGQPDYRLQGYPDPVYPGTRPSSPHVQPPRGFEIRFRLP